MKCSIQISWKNKFLVEKWFKTKFFEFHNILQHFIEFLLFAGVSRWRKINWKCNKQCGISWFIVKSGSQWAWWKRLLSSHRKIIDKIFEASTFVWFGNGFYSRPSDWPGGHFSACYLDKDIANGASVENMVEIMWLRNSSSGWIKDCDETNGMLEWIYFMC